jgi:hypothetical protein
MNMIGFVNLIIIVNNNSCYVPDLVDHIQARLDPHDHNGCCHRIRYLGIRRNNGHTFYSPDRKPCTGVNGMRIFFAVDHNIFS